MTRNTTTAGGLIESLEGRQLFAAMSRYSNADFMGVVGEQDLLKGGGGGADSVLYAGYTHDARGSRAPARRPSARSNVSVHDMTITKFRPQAGQPWTDYRGFDPEIAG